MCERAIPATNPDQARPYGCHRVTPHVRSAIADDALDELEFHWGSAYHLAILDGICTARRRDGKGGTLTSPVPEGLRLLIVADYAAMPVPRNLP
jgi:hypothetical protein